MHNSRAYTLIELMVTIGILSILVAMAVPLYNKYMISARLSTIVPVLSSLVDEAVGYANIHGVYPNAAQLSANGSGYNLTAANVGLDTYLEAVHIADYDGYTGGTACGRRGFVTGTTSNQTGKTTALGFNSSEVNAVNFICIMANINKKNLTKCFFQYGLSGYSFGTNYAYVISTPQTESLLPGWKTANATSNIDAEGLNLSDYSAYVESHASCIG